MQLEEALEVLGVSREATDDEVRRAYLKCVRRHPPERDPEGFKRTREAYELARAILPFIREGAEVFEPPALESQEVESETLESEEAEEAEARVEIQPAPSDITAPDPVWQPGDAELAEEHARAGRWRKAARHATMALKRARTELFAPVPSGYRILEIALRLEARRDFHRVDRLLAAYRRWRAELGPEDWPTRSDDAGRMAVLQELVKVREQLTPEIRKALVRAILTDDGRAARDMGTEMAEVHPNAARSLRYRIEDDAPTLLALLGGLEPPSPPPQARDTRGIRWPMLIVPLMYLLSRGSSLCNEDTAAPTPPIQMAPPAVRAKTTDAAEPAKSPQHEEEETQAWMRARDDADELDRARRPADAKWTRNVTVALHQSCDAARELAMVLEPNDPDAVRRFATLTYLAFLKGCPVTTVAKLDASHHFDCAFGTGCWLVTSPDAGTAP